MQSRPRLRLLGVSLSGFAEQRQGDMFGATSKGRVTDEVQDRVNLRFGSGSLVRAGVLRARKQD
jgi:DNA polymerase-4